MGSSHTHWEGYLCFRGSSIPQEDQGNSSPTPGLPSLGLQCQKEEYPQNLAGKISGDSGRLGETGGDWISRWPLRGPVHRFTCSQELTLGCSRWTAVHKVSETYRERQLCGFRARGGGIATIVPLLSLLPVKPAGKRHLIGVEPSPPHTHTHMAKSESILA